MAEKFNQPQFFADIQGTETYRMYQRRADVIAKESTPEEAREARSRAVGNSILSLGEELSPDKSALYSMLAEVNEFANAEKQLNSLERSHNEDDYQHRGPFLREVIHFNHRLKTSIDMNPSLGFNETAYLMANIRGAAYGANEAKRFYQDAKSVLNGMRHEIGAAQIIDESGTFIVDYDRPVSIRNDSQGVDLWVRRLGDERSFGVDVKSSRFSAEHGRDVNGYGNIVWSQCTSDDFGDRLRLPYDVAKSKAPAMRRELNAAYVLSSQSKRR